jgi:hypothetical protein
MNFDRKYLLCGLFYAVAGMGLGLYMGASHNHAQHVTHAHILLLGFVVSLIYGVIHKLWLGERVGAMATVQFIAHHLGAVTMFTGLFLMFGNLAPEAEVGPVLGIAAMIILSGVLMMLFMVIKAAPAAQLR